MGQIKVRGKMQRVAVIDDNRVLARNVRYSTVKGNAKCQTLCMETSFCHCILINTVQMYFFYFIGQNISLENGSFRTVPSFLQLQ